MRRLDALLGRKPTAPAGTRDGFFDLASMFAAYTTTSDGLKADPISGEFTSYVDGGLKDNGAVFALERIRLSVFSEARFQWQAFVAGRPGRLFGTPELAILERPWAGGTTGDLLSRMLLDADLAGNAYVTIIDGELVRLRPDWVRIILTDRYDPSGFVVGQKKVGFRYYEGGPAVCREPADFLADQVAHFAPMPDPLATYKGMSWLTPVVRQVQSDVLMGKHKVEWFENAATPNLAVSMKEGISPDQFREFVDLMDRSHKGADKAGKTLYTANGADVTVIGANMQQMDFTGVQGATQTQLANAAGVPVTIAGFSEGLAGSSLNAGNYQAAKRNFADGTMRNLWRNVAGSLEVLVENPNQGSRLWYDERDVAFLRDDETQRAEIASTDGQLMRTLIDAGYEPASVVAYMQGDYDVSALVHSGLFSVQLQAPGSMDAPDPVEAPVDVPDPNAGRSEIHVHVDTPDVNVTVEPPNVTVEGTTVRVEPQITVEAADIHLPAPEPRTVRKTITRDADGEMTSILEEELNEEPA